MIASVYRSSSRDYDASRDDYFDWLCSKVVDGYPDSSDEKLLRQLYSLPFVYVIANDSHRYDDGIGLRSLYRYETDNEVVWEGPCSVLEVLVSMAKMVGEDVLGTYYNDKRTYEWFWMMVDNLGLRGVGEVEVEGIVGTWVNREFDYDGRGSPFPLRKPPEDQRTVEIWKQICNYIYENRWLEE